MASEKYANNPSSTLNGAINSAVTSLVVTSATGFSTQPNFRLLIDSEYLLVTAVAGTTFTVTRGIEGSTAASHSNGATITQLLTAAGLQQLMTDHTALTDPHAGKYPLLSTVTTKGDLTPATGNAAVGRLAAGTNNFPLVADSAQTTGLRYGGAATVVDLTVSGLSGATAAAHFVGATASGSPVSGTFAVRDVVIDATGKIWICTVAGTPGTWIQVSVGATGATGATGGSGSVGPPGPVAVVSSVPYICIQDQKAQNTAGGTFTSGAWQTRTLNTVTNNDNNIASLVANQIILPAGSYRTHVRAPGNNVGVHQVRLQNITVGATILNGGNSGNGAIQADSILTGKFGITSTTTIEVQHRCTSTSASNGFGAVTNFAGEIYTSAEFWLEGLPPPVGNSGNVVSRNPDFDYTRRRWQSAWAAM